MRDNDKNREPSDSVVVPLHPQPVEPPDEVVEGQLISDEEFRELTSQKAQALTRWRGYRSDAVMVVQVTRDVATHDTTKAVVRELTYIPIGAATAFKRVWRARTNSRYERMMDAAMAAGDLEAVAEWEQRGEQARMRRHSRRMDWIAAPVQVAKGIGVAAATTVGGLLGLGVILAAADHDIHMLGKPLMVAAEVVRDVSIVVSVAWGPLVLAAPWLGVLGLWHLGRRHGNTPAWLSTSADADVDLAIDETTIARALEALRIPHITAYLKQGTPLQYLTPARRDGRGTHAVLRLPAGVTAERIARRRADLATGLHRLAKEVWPTTGSEEGILDLWIADKGALAEGAGSYPLLTDGTVDVFKGVPLGKTLRGDPILAPLMERNTLTGGMPGQGKSSSARAMIAGASLDPTAEIRIGVPDSNFDFELFKPRCSRYVMGAEDDKIKEILEDLRELYAEVQTRGDILVKQREPAVTRRLASAGIGLHPLFYLLEEAHIAIQHKTYGKEISQLLIDIVKLGRKRGIHMILSTQAPTKDSMPRDVTRNCSNGIAFAVGDHVANDALLGQGAYKAGHRATELIPGVDLGTAVCKGLTGERSDIVQVYFISIKKDNDQLTPIIQRAMGEIERLGQGVPGTTVEAIASTREVEQRDLLDDLDEVLGTERVRLADLPGMLRNLAPNWGPYESLNGARLRELLTDYGVRIITTGNVPRLDPVDLRRVLLTRSTADLDEE